MARDGAALGEALDGLRTTFEVVRGIEPDFASVEALTVAWSEATLEFLHGLSCEDPLTGLTSFAHLRTRLDELYREAEQTGQPLSTGHALVVVEMTSVDPAARGEHQFNRVIRLVQVAGMIRAVFSGGETVARLGVDRATALVRRAPQLGAQVAMLRELVADLDLGPTNVRVWIEGLPAEPLSAMQLLDDLAR